MSSLRSLTPVKCSPTLVSTGTDRGQARMSDGTAIIRNIPAGWGRDEFIAWLQRDSDVIVVDLSDAPSGTPTHVIVKRASGFVAAWDVAGVDQAADVARECNRLAPSDRAHVSAWDDSVWDVLLGAQS